MSRVSDLENKVASLEKNVGMLAKLADVDCCLSIAQYSSIVNYDEGIQSAQKQEEIKEIENRRRELESQFASQFASNEEKHEIPWKLIYRILYALMKLMNIDVIIDYCDSSNIMTIIDGKTQSKIIEISLDDLYYKVVK